MNGKWESKVITSLGTLTLDPYIASFNVKNMPSQLTIHNCPLKATASQPHSLVYHLTHGEI